MIAIERAALKTLRQLAAKLFKPKPASAGRNGPVTTLRPGRDGTVITVAWGERELSQTICSDRLSSDFSCCWDWLKDCEGNSGHVQLSLADNHVELVWDVDGFPQSRQIELLESNDPTPATAELQPIDVRLIAALAAAGETTDQESSRYALSNIQLDGQDGSVVGTDGRQLVRFDGFGFPWTDRAILVPATNLFSSAPLSRVVSLACGADDDAMVLRADDWTIRLPIEKEGRYPNVALVLGQQNAPSNRVYLDARDLDFFARHVKQLPGGKREHAPVTLELNGRVELTAAGDEQTRPMRIRLSRCVHLGDPISCSLNRNFLHRAARLGAKELLRYGEAGPLVCRGDQLTYLAQPLSDVTPLPESADLVTVDSAVGR